MSAEDDGLERAAKYLERRADEIERRSDGGLTAQALATIYRDEAQKIREMKNNP